MTTKLTFETDQDDETVRTFIVGAAKQGIYFKSCRLYKNTEQSTTALKYSMSYRHSMKENKEIV